METMETKTSNLMTSEQEATTAKVQQPAMYEEEIPQDWMTTCAIYDIEKMSVLPMSNLKSVACGKVECRVEEFALLVRNVAIIQRASTGTTKHETPQFGCLVITKDQSPTVRISFCYVGEELHAVSLCWSNCPIVWPSQNEWETWLNEEASKLVDKEGSAYPVLDFLEHRSVDFYAEPFVLEDDIVLSFHQHFSPYHTTTKSTDVTDLKHRAERYIAQNWKEWVDVECPICFDKVKASTATEITCGHAYCHDCISSYARVTVNDIRQHTDNPFRCPLPQCRKSMKIVGCVKHFLEEEEMNLVRSWYKDIKNPLSYLLVVCPKCKVRDQIRHVARDSNIVCCESCKGTWCERCLQRATADEHFEHLVCDTSRIAQKCKKFREASEIIKAKALQKWPWLREYAAGTMVDQEALAWVKANASQCPSCQTAIERIEGCFHMTCTNCTAHFCYECGDEIFAPYYGTHHCWLEDNNMEE